jgi:hypothetical protein
MMSWETVWNCLVLGFVIGLEAIGAVAFALLLFKK